MAAEAEITFINVEDAGATDNAVRSKKLDLVVNVLVEAITLSICLNVTQVTDVAHFGHGSTVSLVEGIEVTGSSLAALNEVAVLVHVESVLLARGQASESTDDRRILRGRLLLELNNTFGNLIRLNIHDANSTSGVALDVENIVVETSGLIHRLGYYQSSGNNRT